jgi:hypothetical protein
MAMAKEHGPPRKQDMKGASRRTSIGYSSAAGWANFSGFYEKPSIEGQNGHWSLVIRE